MSVIDDQLASTQNPERGLLEHMYTVVRRAVPVASEEFSYAIPAFKYRGKSLLAIQVNERFISLYPFCDLRRLELDLSDFETTSGSIHFTPDKPISDELLRQIVDAKLRQIDEQASA